MGRRVVTEIDPRSLGVGDGSPVTQLVGMEPCVKNLSVIHFGAHLFWECRKTFC